MKPIEFLNDEFGNVGRALEETLRYDYGPAPVNTYYEECRTRLREIGKAIKDAGADPQEIATLLNELSSLANWICLIERSHLGEFSWPFASELREMADQLLAESWMENDTVKPIVHIIAEGEDYKIVFEPQIPPASAERKFVIIAFPRSLKHDVLLHALFGHELGHAALNTNAAGPRLQKDVLGALSAAGPLSSTQAINEWLHSSSAPSQTESTLNNYNRRFGKSYAVEEYYLKQWQIELTCDMFGMILFGPAFFAAHRTYLEATHPNAHGVDDTKPTHPPYAIRYKMLRRTMTRCGWHKPLAGC